MHTDNLQYNGYLSPDGPLHSHVEVTLIKAAQNVDRTSTTAIRSDMHVTKLAHGSSRHKHRWLWQNAVYHTYVYTLHDVHQNSSLSLPKSYLTCGALVRPLLEVVGRGTEGA